MLEVLRNQHGASSTERQEGRGMSRLAATASTSKMAAMGQSCPHASTSSILNCRAVGMEVEGWSPLAAACSCGQAGCNILL